MKKVLYDINTTIRQANTSQWMFYLVALTAVALLFTGCLLLHNTISSPFSSMQPTHISCKMKFSILLQGLGVLGLFAFICRKF